MTKAQDLTPQFPQVLDSTILSTYLACPQKWYYRHCLGLTSVETSPDLHAGACFARALEVTRRAYYDNGRDAAAAIDLGCGALIEAWGDYEPPSNNPKTLDRMLGALDYYFQQWPLDDRRLPVPVELNGRAAVECTFALPIADSAKEYLHPETGEPLLFAGRYDMFAQDSTGKRYIVDEKTTKALGASWPQQWRLRGQFTAYAWAAREYGTPADTILIRGVCIQKTQYRHAEAIVYRSSLDISRWHEMLIRTVPAMIETYRSAPAQLPLRVYSDACSSYGGCQFADLCAAKYAEQWYSTFSRKFWNPLEVK